MVILRKLTEKSIIDFGRYRGLKVGDLITKLSYPYLRWIYYNCSNLTFFDNILDLIGITEDWRIPKPGKDKEKGKAIDASKKRRRSLEVRSHSNWKVKKISKSNYANLRSRERISFSKGSLMNKNHGH